MEGDWEGMKSCSIIMARKGSEYNNPSLILDAVVVNLQSKNGEWNSLSSRSMGPFVVHERGPPLRMYNNGQYPGTYAQNGERISLCRSLDNYLASSVVYKDEVQSGYITPSYFERRAYLMFSSVPMKRGTFKPQRCASSLYFEGKVSPLSSYNTYRCYYYNHLARMSSEYQRLHSLKNEGHTILLIDDSLETCECGFDMNEEQLLQRFSYYKGMGPSKPIPSALMLNLLLRDIVAAE